MSNIDKHAVQAVADLKAGYTLGHADVAILNELFAIALASLEAEGGLSNLVASQESLGGDFEKVLAENIEELYVPGISAPPAPVSVPDELTREEYKRRFMEDDDFDDTFSGGWNACRAAMLQGAEPVTTAYKLPEDFDFDRFNDVVWLEAVASNPHMHSLTTSTIAMVALELNKRLNVANSPVIPDGWVMVPVEPTMEMLDEFDSIIDHGAEDSKEAWSRLIAAAPQQEVKS
ncbi:hypothetical protein [Enterobacter cloacae]|uniref:hypothetical protein n=1 Tax=Enterobacter cloacae TaxID=550 RepID=UPI003754F136